jgi:hypothetical protein
MSSKTVRPTRYGFRRDVVDAVSFVLWTLAVLTIALYGFVVFCLYALSQMDC